MLTLLIVPVAASTHSPATDSCDPSTLPGAMQTTPNAANTGVPPDTRLTRIVGDYHTNVYGEVVDRLDITGKLYIDHDNVKVKCTRVWGQTTNNATGLQMWLSTLGDPRGVRDGSALKWSDYTLRRVEIMGTFDGLKAEGDVDVRDSYIHDLFRTEDDTQPNGVTHNDGVQIARGSGMVFRHNTFDMWSFTDGQTAGANRQQGPFGDGEGYTTSAFMITGLHPVKDVLIEDNLIRGRTSKYIHVTREAAKGVKIIGNKMGRENRDYPSLFAVTPGTVVRGNTFLDGSPAERVRDGGGRGGR